MCFVTAGIVRDVKRSGLGCGTAGIVVRDIKRNGFVRL